MLTQELLAAAINSFFVTIQQSMTACPSGYFAKNYSCLLSCYIFIYIRRIYYVNIYRCRRCSDHAHE